MNCRDQAVDLPQPLQYPFPLKLIRNLSEYRICSQYIRYVKIVGIRYARDAELEFTNRIVVHKFERGRGAHYTAPRVVYMFKVVHDFLASRESVATCPYY